MKKKMGRPPMAEEAKRVKQSVLFKPCTRELARLILAKKYDHFVGKSSNGRPGWGHVVDEAMERWAEELGLIL